MKSYTDIEQSKKLAEILPLESADMEYMFLKKDNSKVSNVPFVKDDNEPEWPDDSSYDFIPCWSLAALLNALPSGKALIHDKGSHGYKCICKNTDSYLYDNPIDACYKMIIKLHEQKLL